MQSLGPFSTLAPRQAAPAPVHLEPQPPPNLRRLERLRPSPSRPVRVVAVVRNGVSSDLRVLKTCNLIQDSGFQSSAIGWSDTADAPYERHHTGVEIHRAQSGSHNARSFLLCRSALSRQCSLREAIEEDHSAWVSREIQSLLDRPAPTQVPSSRCSPSSDSGRWRSLPGIVRALGKRAHSGAGRVLNLVAPTHANRLHAHKMMAYLAETFWDIYPLLVTSEADLIHAHELTALLPAVVAGRQLNVPVIYDSHELEFARNSPWCAETFAFWAAHERDLIQFVDGVIAVSDGCAAALREQYGVPEDLVTVVRNCPSLHQQEPKQSLREVIRLPDDAPLLVFVGKVTRNRGLELMLEVLRKLPGFSLACVGPNDSGYRKGLERSAKVAGVQDRLFFVPAVAGDEVVPFISQADVSVMPIQDACLSYRYCLPNKLFESAHAGVPVVASALPDMQAFVARYEIGTTADAEDPDHWALAIESVYQRRDSYFTPAKIARIRRESSAENEVAKVCALYHRVLSESVALPA